MPDNKPRSAFDLLMISIIVGILLLLLSSAWRTSSGLHVFGLGLPKPESAWAMKQRWQFEARSAVTNACPKAIIGFSRVIELRLDSSVDNPSKWKAQVEVDFINQVGGIQRTNYPFIFTLSSPDSDSRLHVGCYADSLELSRRAAADHAETLRRIKAGLPR